MPDKILKDAIVSINYKLTDDKGEVLDSSDETGPLDYLHGHGQIVKGLEQALDDKGVGDNVKITVPPEEGYGNHEDKLVIKVPRDQFDFDIQPGMILDAQDPQGGHMPFQVKEVGDDEVTLDGNHPLAGMSLNFDVTIKAIREASEEELSHGHVHGEGCQHHHDEGCDHQHGDDCKHDN